MLYIGTDCGTVSHSGIQSIMRWHSTRLHVGLTAAQWVTVGYTALWDDTRHACMWTKCVSLASDEKRMTASYDVLQTCFRHLREVTISDYQLRHVCLSVRPHGATRLPTDEFSWNLIFEYSRKICRENSRFIKIWQKVGALFMKTEICSWQSRWITPGSMSFRQICGGELKHKLPVK
jgi:hypothetical protein